MDINAAINQLGLNANTYRLTQSVPPHTIVQWNGPDAQPTDAAEASRETIRSKYARMQTSIDNAASTADIKIALSGDES